MGNVIKMDLYRLVKSLSFKICLIVVLVLSLTDGPITKIVYDLGKKVAESADDGGEALAKLGEWSNEFHFGNIIASQLGVICTAVFLLCIVWFCFADIQHGYIKNIAGQLPSRGHTIVSKFAVIEFALVIFFVVKIIGETAGQLIIGREMKLDMFYAGTDGAPDQVFSLGAAFAELGVKLLLLSGICALVLLLTTGVGSNIAGTIVAVLCGAGFTGLAYSGITAGINKLFKTDEFDLSCYMPDSLYRTDLWSDELMLNGLIMGIASIAVLMYFTFTLYNKKDIK